MNLEFSLDKHSIYTFLGLGVKNMLSLLELTIIYFEDTCPFLRLILIILGLLCLLIVVSFALQLQVGNI